MISQSGKGPLLLAEIGQTHEGVLALAHGLIDSIAEAGFDGVKFQVHDADSESTLDEKFRPGTGFRDINRFAYWRRTSFNSGEWRELIEHARQNNLLVVPSTFSARTIEMMSDIGVDGWKVGSGEALQTWFLRAIAEKKQPTILSTGMSAWHEIRTGVEILLAEVPWLAVLQSTSAYPVGPDAIGLDVMIEIGRRFDVKIGLSDHSGSTVAAMVALARGAQIIEVHATYSKLMAGPDSTASLTFEEMKVLSDFRDAIVSFDSSRVSKDELALDLADVRKIFGRSIAPATRIPAGTRIEEHMLIPKKPGGGIPFSELSSVVGKTAVRDLDPRRLLRRGDLD